MRDIVVFTDHDALADPPFSRLDLVSCRNLLIYLQPDEQQKLLSLFHFALRERGYLFLGASEAIGPLTEFFQPASDTLEIFRRTGHGWPRDRAFSPDLGERARALWPRLAGRANPKVPDIADMAQRFLLDTLAPAAVLVDRNYRVLYSGGPTDRYLRLPAGAPSHDAMAMLREGLAPKFRAAVRQASRDHAAVTIGGARVRRNGDVVPVSISALPLPHEGEELVLVSFVDEPERKPADTAETPAEASRATQLEQELADTRKDESTIRELEDSNQEMGAVNEEALSINEEFQSTNEELETSKEELQSLNEELTTTNNQLNEALERQRRTSDDLQNILNSSDAATLFLDEQLNIRFFTPSAASRFSLIASDVGRPLADLAKPFTDIDLIADARTVLADLGTMNREVRTAMGAWYTCRTAPYRTQDNRIEGVVISLSEISEIKAAEQVTQAARTYAEAVIDTVDEPLIVLDEAMRVVSAGRSFYRILDASPTDTVDRLLPDSDAHHLDVPALRAFLDRVKSSSDGPLSTEIEVDLPQLGQRTLIVTAAHVQREGGVPGLVLISLHDITDSRRAGQQIADARQAADDANLAKSRFLAAVSHDLRQPLQTLSFLLDLLRGEFADPVKAADRLRQADGAIDSMSGMLNALLDINQLESGIIHPEPVDFPINDLLDRLAAEFLDHASARGLGWHVVRCGLGVHSDPHLLGQMLRNLLSNAIRYTAEGRVLLGCRRHGDNLCIEVWDTGVGIAEAEVPRIFEEYHRVAGHDDDGSPGLGLAIVRRLGELLGHPISVRSRLGKGSVFAIDVPLVRRLPERTEPSAAEAAGAPRLGAILIIDDKPPLRETLQPILARQGHRTAAAGTGSAALALVESGFRPDLIVSDYVLQGGMNGAQTVKALRAALGRQVPVVFLTGDIRSASLRDIELTGSVRLTKPVKPDELLQAVQQQLLAAPWAGEEPAASSPVASADTGPAATIFVVDDNRGVREAMREALSTAGYRVEAFASGEAFLAYPPVGGKSCLVIDVRLPGISGLELLARLAAGGNTAPAILITGHGEVAMAVAAMRAGAFDFLEKPVRQQELLDCIDRALRHITTPAERASWRTAVALRVAGLTAREREVMDLVVAGRANKQIAARLDISQRTVETHRANVMKKMGVASLSDLVRLGLAARGDLPQP